MQYRVVHVAAALLAVWLCAGSSKKALAAGSTGWCCCGVLPVCNQQPGAACAEMSAVVFMAQGCHGCLSQGFSFCR